MPRTRSSRKYILKNRLSRKRISKRSIKNRRSRKLNKNRKIKSKYMRKSGGASEGNCENKKKCFLHFIQQLEDENSNYAILPDPTCNQYKEAFEKLHVKKKLKITQKLKKLEKALDKAQQAYDTKKNKLEGNKLLKLNEEINNMCDINGRRIGLNNLQFNSGPVNPTNKNEPLYNNVDRHHLPPRRPNISLSKQIPKQNALLHTYENLKKKKKERFK